MASPAVRASAPGRSTLRLASSSRDSGSSAVVSTRAITTTGTFTRNTARQSNADTRPPPSSGATDIARPAAIAHAATPRPTSERGRAAVITASDSE